MFSRSNTINTTAEAHGGHSFKYLDNYWSSTEKSGSLAVMYWYRNDISLEDRLKSLSKNGYVRVRAIRSF
jgi:hypothetical protein